MDQVSIDMICRDERDVAKDKSNTWFMSSLQLWGTGFVYVNDYYGGIVKVRKNESFYELNS